MKNVVAPHPHSCDRMFLIWGFSDVSLWLGSDHAFHAEILHTGCYVLLKVSYLRTLSGHLAPLVMLIWVIWLRGCLIFLQFNYFFSLATNGQWDDILRPHKYLILHQKFSLDLASMDDFCLIESLLWWLPNADFLSLIAPLHLPVIPLWIAPSLLPHIFTSLSSACIMNFYLAAHDLTSLFWCSYCPRFGQWEPPAGDCVLATCHRYVLSTFLTF